MTFAAKIGKNETIKLTTQQQTFLTITNIALAPKQSKASLYLRQKKSDDFILIVELDRKGIKSYSCNIKLHIKRDDSQQLFSEYGETNLIGNVESSLASIQITREMQELNKKEDEKQNKIQARPKRSDSFNKKETMEAKIKNKKQENIKKPKTLLQMMNNLEKVNSSESDDESYQQQSQSQDQDDSQQSQKSEDAARKQISKTKQSAESSRNKKKKNSWAQMLHDEMNAKSSNSDKSKEQDEQEEQLDDQTPEASSKKKKNKQIAAQKEEKKVSLESSQKKQTKKRIKNFSLTLSDEDQDQQAFEYVVPKGLPSFLKKS